MSTPTGAFVVRNGLFTVEGTDYANQAKKFRLVPDTPVQSYRTCVPDGIVQDIDSSVWTLEITGLQINRSGGLAKLLRDTPAGDQLDIVMAPKNASGEDKATFTVLCMPPPFGDEQGKYAEIDLPLPVLGTPVWGTVA